MYERMSLVDVQQITEAFDDVFDQATADPRTGILPEYLRYRFRHCVRASVTSAVTPETWRRSLDDRLIDFEQGRELDGYVWGVRWQVLYPGAKLLPGTAETDTWSGRLGRPFHEALIETNGHNIALVFSDLSVDRVEPPHDPAVAAPARTRQWGDAWQLMTGTLRQRLADAGAATPSRRT